MPGDVSQPGDAPRAESNPWSLLEPEPTWWPADADPDGDGPAGSGDDPGRRRHPRRRPPQFTNIQPTQTQPTQTQPTQTQPTQTQPTQTQPDPAIKQRAAEELRTEPGGVERDHNRPDPFRYDPLRPPAGYPGRADLITDAPAAGTPQPAPAPEAPAPAEPRHAEPEPPVAPPEPEPEPEPDVMVLPEPDNRNRPTVPLGKRAPAPVPAPVPGQGRVRPTEPLPRPTGDADTDARLEKLENSPFWLSEAERTAAGRRPDVSSHTAERTRRGRRGRRVRPTAIRRPAPALFALISLALVASFFSWVSAEPFWLAAGHGDQGYATTTACRGSGVAQRCVGRFDAADGSFAITRVTLLGVAAGKRTAGAVTPARMVSAGSRTAYLGNAGFLVHLRWVLGFVLVLICGYGIAGLTGARRLDDPRARRLTTLASLSAPLILLAGFLFAAY
jgi:hypothetical protein